MSARIAAVTITPLAFADPPLLNADGVHERHVLRGLVELHVETADGRTVTGLGECTGHAWQLDYLELLAPQLVGLSVFDRGALQRIVTEELSGSGDGDGGWRRWSDRPDSTDSRGPAPMPAKEFDQQRAFSVLEVALLDAQGRVLGVPMVDLLGGAVRERVPFSAYLFYKWGEHPALDGEPGLADDWGPALDPAGIVEQARRMVDRYGFGSLKLKGGVFEPGAEIEAIAALRRAFPELPLRLDPNAAWSVPTAIDAAHRLEGMLEYLEDPAPGIEGMAAVARETSLPLATNMVVVSAGHIAPAVAAGAISVILGDHHYWGGMRGSLDLSAVARALDWNMSMHSNSHLGVSLAAMTAVVAAMPSLGHACDTHYPWNEADDIVRDPTRFENGTLAVDDRPGLGVELDRTAVDRLHQTYLELHREHRNDGAYRARVEPGFDTGLPRW
ncbi:enolase C-terminal domain-like protein [Pseudactinotalea sp.]|uniref:enolase C-terminal domain-like protein n=1 Tax=Pseudactinotalea sp. TaxID=1926260 RepID=UPI003B3B70B6